MMSSKDLIQKQSIKSDPERFFAMLAFLLGLIASLIAWGSSPGTPF